jgi:chromosomal replication initiation ATPase DnaA
LGRRDPEIARLLELVAAELGVPIRMLVARSRCRAEIAEARWLAMYLAHVALGRSILSLARLFSRNWSTVSRACMHLEDERDRPEFDAFIGRLETMLSAANENHRPQLRIPRRVAR